MTMNYIMKINQFKSITLFIVLALSSSSAVAQTVGVSSSPAYVGSSKAILDLDASAGTKGFLAPRMTAVERGVVGSPSTGFTLGLGLAEKGITIFNTTSNLYEYWDGSAWQEIPNVANTGNTLDEAYDEGGPGAGRIINATNGNVEIAGSGFLTVASNVGIGITNPDRRMKISGAGWTALEVENTDAQDAAIELTSQGVSNYVFTDETGFLGLESATGRQISFRTDGPNERMVVQSDGRVRVNNLADPNSAVILSNPSGVLGKRPLTGIATDVLLGTGAFGPASAFEDDDWYQVNSTNTPTAIGDWIYTNGRVGIGVGSSSNPNAPLEVAATGSGNPANNSILANNYTNSAGNDAIITARVAGSSAGDPFFSLDISGEAGWSLGIDNSDDNRFKIAPSWSDLSLSTAMTIQTDGNVGIGSASPIARLDIAGNAALNDNQLRLRGGNDGNHFLSYIGGSFDGAKLTGNINVILNTMTGGDALVVEGSNVGIGTSSPDNRLVVKGNMSIWNSEELRFFDGDGTDQRGTIGRINGTGDMIVASNAAGNWLRIGANNSNIAFFPNNDYSSNNDPTFIMTETGRLGVGTSAPIARIHAEGGILSANFGARYYSVGGGNAYFTTDRTLSGYFQYDLACGELQVFSDARIKNIIGVSNAKSDLETLMDIKITDYSFKDYKTNSRTEKKVIAQQVEKVYPSAVSKGEGYIPNIYALSKAQFNTTEKLLTITLEGVVDILAGDKIKLIMESGNSKVVDVVSVSETSFTVSVDSFDGDKVFVYGKQVDDFRSVDYDAIAMLNISATQELFRQIQVMKTMIDGLESENQALRNQSEWSNENFNSLKAEVDALKQAISLYGMK